MRFEYLIPHLTTEFINKVSSGEVLIESVFILNQKGSDMFTNMLKKEQTKRN